jgi:hypothetical protein
MKKFLALLAVVAIVCLSSMAFAADVTVGGSYEIRSRDFMKLNFFDSAANAQDTQNRLRLDVNAKAGDDVKGKIEIEQDFGTGAQDWGTANGSFQTPNRSYNVGSTSTIGFRELWMSFNVPGVPVNVTGGHQLLQLGNGWFFKAKHFGADAWVVANKTGDNTAAFVDVKISEGSIATNDDVDAYALVDVLKLNENMAVGVDFTMANDRRGLLGSVGAFGATTHAMGAADTAIQAQNLGLNFNGKLGPVALNAELDVQMGKAKAANLVSGASGTYDSGDATFKGNQIVIQGKVPMDPVTINFTVARGSGDKAGSKDYDGYKAFLDIDPHYTFLYEYKIATATGSKNTGFGNTTAVSVGAMFAATKSVNIGADVWMLQATEKTNVTLTGAAKGATSNDLGTELDVKVQWKMYDNLAWNWDFGVFAPGAAYKDVNGKGTETAVGAQGVLAFKF